MNIILQSVNKVIANVFVKGPHGERGQDLAEYAMLLGLIALIVIVAVTLLGDNISAVFSRLALGLPY